MKTWACILLFFLGVVSNRAASLLWTNTAGGSWQTAANWSPNVVPGANDTATITAAGTYTITLANNVNVSNVQLGGGAGFPTILVASHTFKATNSATISANGTLTLTGGGLEGKINVVGGVLKFEGANQKSLYSATLFTSATGTIQWKEGNLAVGSTPTTFINNTGLLEISGDDTLFQGIGGPDPEITNSGTITKIGGSGTTTFSNIRFKNTGTVTAQIGTIQFTGQDASEIGGTFTAQSGATIQLAGGTYTEKGGVFNGAGTLRMTAGTLTMVTNQLSGLLLAGGTLRVQPTFQASGAITNLTINGASLAGTNEVAGNLNVASGAIIDFLTVRPTGTLTFSSATQKSLYELRLVNNGTVKWLEGNLALGSTPTTLITNTGLWEINSDELMFQGIGGPDPVFVNQGTLRKLGGSGTTTFSNLKFVNSGLVEAQNGTITFNGMNNAILGGTFTAQPGATIQFSGGTYTENGGTFGGGGTLQMTAGTLTLVNNLLNGLTLTGGTVRIASTFQNNGAITNLTLNGSTLAGTNEVSGSLTVVSGALMDLLTIRTGATLTFSSATQKSLYELRLINNGTVKWLGGNLALGSTPTTLITNVGLWEINSDDLMFQGIGGPDPVFVNQGTLRKLGGSGTTTFSNLKFVNSGLVEAQNGTLTFNGMDNAVLGGTFTAQPGATIQFSGGTYTENGGTFGGAGTLRMTAGTLTLVNNPLSGLTLTGGTVKLTSTFQDNGAITNLTLNGSTLSGTNEVSGSLTVVSGALMDLLTIRSGATLTFSSATQKSLYELRLINNGTVKWLGGNLALGSTPTTLITNVGLWEINSDELMFQGIGGPNPVFVNQGTLRKLGGSGTTTFSNLQFVNSGLVEAQNGGLTFNGMDNASLGGTFTAQPGATIQFSGGTYTENGGVFNGGGVLRMTAGTLTLVTNKLNGLSLNGGNVRVLSTFQAAGAITDLTLSGATLIGTNEVAGTLSVLSGAIQNLLTVRPGGILSLSTATQKSLYELRLINNGTVKWLGGNLALGSTPTTLITNIGLWEINSDDLMFQGIGGPDPVFVNQGTLRKLGGSGTTTFSNLKFVNAGLVEVLNGTITFNGMNNAVFGGTFTAAAGASILLAGGTYMENAGVFNGAGTLRMNSGTLSLVTNILTGLSLSGGNVRVTTNTFQAAGAITNLTLNGATLIGTNEIEGTLTVASGGINGLLTVRPNGKLIFTSTAQKSLYELTLNNNGTVLWQGGNLALGSTPTTIIANAGLWDASDDSLMFQGIGGPDPIFSNAATGTFRKSAGAGVTSLSNFTFNNNGVVEAQTGTIRFPNPFTHNNGKLRLAGGRIEASGTFTFASGTLEGSGSFGGSTFTGGTISPGINGPGKITFTSGLNLSSGVTVVIDGVNTTPGTGHDQLAVTGAVALGGANLNVASIAALAVGSRLIIIENDGVDGVTGLFNAYPEGWLFTHNFQLFRVRYSVGTGNDVAIIRDDGGVRLTAIAVQPDGSFLLNGLGTNFGIYTISATTNFQSWVDIGTTTANSGGNFQFTDTNAPQFRLRFYRSLGPGVSFP